MGDRSGGGLALCQQSCPQLTGEILMNSCYAAETVLEKDGDFNILAKNSIIQTKRPLGTLSQKIKKKIRVDL